MWFDKVKIDALEQALKTGQRTGIESILRDLSVVDQNPNKPTFCPRCGKPFVVKQIRYFHLNVPSCPNGHGFWLDTGIAQKIKRFFEHAGTSPSFPVKRKIDSFRLFVIFTGIALGLFSFYKKPADHSETNYKTSFTMEHAESVGANNWPDRDFSQWNPFPAGQATVTDPQELDYIYAWMDIVNDGIVNRLNMQDALIAERPSKEYEAVYEFFEYKQKGILYRLNKLTPPPRLDNFHALVLEAVASQIEFYEDYARRRSEDSGVTFNQLTGHPKLKDCDKNLWAAYYEFQRLYPNRDQATNNAIEQRLCWLDLV